MYVNLYPYKALKRTKKALLWGGVAMLCGGMATLLGEFVAQEHIRWGWAIAASLVSVVGAFGFGLGAGYARLNDVYFSMTPERISYRLHFFATVRTLPWDAIDCIQASENTLAFELKDSNQIIMRLGHIQDPKIANHVSVSIQLAAMHQQIEVNQVSAHAHQISM
jgi:hypothetical protein